MGIRHEINDHLELDDPKLWGIPELRSRRVAVDLWFENGPDYLRFGVIKLRCARAGLL